MILYRAKSTITPDMIFELSAEGFDVQDASQVISFPDLQEKYKVGCYNAALKYGSIHALE